MKQPVPGPEADADQESGMSTEAFRCWMGAMGFETDEEAANALDVSVETIRHYRLGRRGTGKPVKISRTFALACAALYHRLSPWTRSK